jgi:hypothetical protein
MLVGRQARALEVPSLDQSAKPAAEPAFVLKRYTGLPGQHSGQKRTREQVALDEDLTQLPPRLHLFCERPLDFLLPEHALLDQQPAEQRTPAESLHRLPLLKTRFLTLCNPESGLGIPHQREPSKISTCGRLSRPGRRPDA